MITVTPQRLALLALDDDTVVGHVMASRVGDGVADIGIVVAEAYKHQGIGTRLMRELLAGHSLTQVRCDVLNENRIVLDWLRRSLPTIHLYRDGNTTTVRGVVRV